MPPRTLVLDVGFRHTGWAVIDNGTPVDCGCIHTDAKRIAGQSRTDEDLAAVCFLAGNLERIAREAQPRLIVAEMPTGGSKSARANACMGMAKAAVAVAVGMGFHNWLLRTVPPRKTKAKAEILVKERWPDWVPPKLAKDREHVVDALAAWIQYEQQENA